MSETEENRWNTQLSDIWQEPGTCCCGLWCAPCLFGSNATKVTGKNWFLMCFAYSVTTFCCLSWVLHSYERKKLRERYSLPPDPECEDSLTTFCCGLCALCQEAREIKLREEEAAVAYEAGGDEPVVSQPRAKSGNPAQLNESYESEEQSEQYESTGVSERV